MEAYVELLREDGTLERHRLEGKDQFTVGRSATADVAIPDGRDLEPEHLLIAPRGDGCWVAISQQAKVKGKVRGEPFEHGMVAWGTEIDFGSIKLKVTDALPKDARSEQKTSPIVVLGAITIIGLVAWMYFSDPGDHGLETTAPTEAFEMFDPPPTCASSADTALYDADESAEAALAKSERYPFDAQDGVESVALYRLAEACYASVGQVDAAQRMQHEGDWMRNRIEEDYTTHRMRLDRAMAQRRWPDALLETRALLGLTRHREHPYVEWLVRNERRLVLMVETRRRRS
jgi:hypothetical protein